MYRLLSNFVTLSAKHKALKPGKIIATKTLAGQIVQIKKWWDKERISGSRGSSAHIYLTLNLEFINPGLSLTNY